MMAYDTAATTDIWYNWTAVLDTTNVVTQNVWNFWVTTAGSTATSTTNQNIWNNWSIRYDSVTYQPQAVQNVYPDYYENPERTTERIERSQRLQQRLAEQDEARRGADALVQRLEDERKAAVAAAEKLLLQHLKPAQRRTYKKFRYFTVKAASGRSYRIYNGWAGNIYEIDRRGKRLANFCIHPTVQCPDEDNMLTQKLLLETNEKQFLQIANRTRVY